LLVVWPIAAFKDFRPDQGEQCIMKAVAQEITRWEFLASAACY
jgi:hypothetical protein